jgi:hypothetical protein
MGTINDNILKKELIEAPEVAMDGYVTEKIDVDNVEAGFSLEVDFENISGESTFSLQFSNSGRDDDFATDLESPIVQTSDGNCIWDVAKTEVTYIRLIVEGDGDPTITRILYVAGRRH